MSALDSLQSADREFLASRWQGLFKCDPPARVHIGLMRGILAWHAQCEASGVKPPPSQSVPVLPDPAASGRPAPGLRQGTRLIREWRGATHEVLVISQGFEYAGETYKSLSAIARAITGTPWSGPAFFGVKR
ncbi:DUF2924 domain-containing protein [Hydrogenophaga sp. BPS33]|uniref:DUF2924 domain-containing protein n=1 Tax=Hydrogenophaga sp. BPS33 TaxID=2651974 RepID=UPI0013586FFE|nr:DUF2924 domain-containing protein [Hydrogenophaga sp. BPS33]